jgi:transcriptional regulator with XRE-family HTH domain
MLRETNTEIEVIKKDETIFEGDDFKIIAGRDYAGAEELRELLLRKGLSIRKASAHLGIAPSTLWRWLNGLMIPHPASMGVLSDFLVDIDRLYPDAPKSALRGNLTASRLKALAKRYGGGPAWFERPDGLALMPASLFSAVLSSDAPRSEIIEFLVGFGTIARRSARIHQALERQTFFKLKR